jgi:hypothetical protein
MRKRKWLVALAGGVVVPSLALAALAHCFAKEGRPSGEAALHVPETHGLPPCPFRVILYLAGVVPVGGFRELVPHSAAISPPCPPPCPATDSWTRRAAAASRAVRPTGHPHAAGVCGASERHGRDPATLGSPIHLLVRSVRDPMCVQK